MRVWPHPKQQQRHQQQQASVQQQPQHQSLFQQPCQPLLITQLPTFHQLSPLKSISQQLQRLTFQQLAQPLFIFQAVHRPSFQQPLLTTQHHQQLPILQA